MTQKITTPDIQPLFDNVLVRPVDAETKTASGIILPDTVKEKPQIGVIMAIGSGTAKKPMLVKAGLKVMYKKWGGNEVKVQNEEWTIISQDDILAIIN